MKECILRMMMFAVVALAVASGTLGSPMVNPTVQVNVPTYLNETNREQSVQIGVNYWETGYTGTITARVEVAEYRTGRYNPGAIKLDSAFASQLSGESNIYYVELSDCTPVNIAIESMDGTDNSQLFGFEIAVSIVASNVSYRPSSSRVYVRNVAPVCVVTPDNDDLPAWEVIIGESSPIPIYWQVSDVEGDFVGTPTHPGIRVSLMGCMNGQSFYLTGPSSGTFVPDFGSMVGNQTVILIIEDKDGGMRDWTYHYNVRFPTETIDGVKWSYSVSGGRSTVLGIKGDAIGDIAIPSELGGRSVEKIGGWAFYGCRSLTSVTIPNSVTNIGGSAFYDCSGLMCVTIPDSVTNIGESAFSGCSGLTNVVFMGDAPVVGSSSFSGVASACVVSVSPKSTGWSVAVGEKWNGLTLQYWPEVLAEAANAAEVGAIMSTFADAGIAAEVASVAEYEAFRAWVDENNLYQPSVVASPHAAAAYLLGAGRLFENEPAVEFGEVTVGAGSVKNMTVTAIVKDGGRTVAVDAAKVAAMFEATSDLGDWNGAARLTPTVTVSGVDANGAMQFIVTPGDGTASRAFLRIRR